MSTPNNLPPQWLGRDAGSFAEYTVQIRLPDIARQVIADNDFDPEIQDRLLGLIDEIPHSRLRPLADSDAPDSEQWNRWVEPYLSLKWLEAPWLFVEVYFFRRILEATRYFLPGPTRGFDPYTAKKHSGLELSWPAIENYCLQQQGWMSQSGPANHNKILASLLRMSLWGNQSDLSMWPAGKPDGPQHSSPSQGGDPLESHILVDDSWELARFICQQAGQDREIDFILDNSGLELIHDLGLADFLLSHSMASFARFHLKSQPFYVSDSMQKDVLHTLDWLASSQEPAVKGLAARLTAHLQAGRLRLQEAPYWSAPVSYWQDPMAFQEKVSSGAAAPITLILVKGDLNYRRLLDDRRWEPTLPINVTFPKFALPLAALRVLKSELAVGLPAHLPAQAAQADPDWMFSGRWGLIQFNS